ncbi:MAG: hypothetical protein QE271_10610 [Bacteriovoracaceae bacterium]|nr:hypothetical protein [Bacteriovoracaceae bacterium]
MKILNGLLLSLCYTILLPAYASLKFSNGAFYSVPYSDVETISLKLDYPENNFTPSVVMKNLSNECANFRKFFKKNPPNNEATIKTYRDSVKQPFFLENSFPDFAAKFKVDADATNKAIAQNRNSANSLLNDRNSNLGNIKQTSISLVLTNYNFIVRSISSDSLTAFADKYGIKPLEIELSNKVPMRLAGDMMEFQNIYIRGRDTFCDLMEGKAVLEASGVSHVSVAPEELEEVSDFYNKSIPPMVEKVFKNQSKIKSRAALVGFHLGEILKSSSDQIVDETYFPQKIESLVDSLFDDSFQKNNLWSKNNPSHPIIIPNYQSLPVALTFQVKK